MANELVIHHPTGATLYALLFDATGRVYNGSTFGAPSSASWTDYDIAMPEAATATGIYRASMPAVPAGAYGWVVRRQAGGSPAVTDITVGAGSIRWTGTAEETVPAAVNVTHSAGVALGGRLAEASDLPAAVTAGVWDAARSGHAGAGTFGATDEWAGSVDEAAIAAAVLGAAAVTPIKAALAASQGAVTFNGQVKILADVDGEGALHVLNSHASGYGHISLGGTVGQYNAGGTVGQYNIGSNPVIGAASQEIADALKRAPAAGTPAVGSVYALLGDAATDPQAVRDAMLLAPTPPGTAAAGSVDALLDGLASSVAAELSNSSDCTASGAISRTRGNTWIIAATIGTITGFTSLWFTLKHSQSGPDSDAILQIKLNSSGTGDGLLYVNGTPSSDSTKASIVVNDASAGTITVSVDEAITAAMPVGTFFYDIQTLLAGAVATPDSGAFTVTADVTRSIA